ncbi:hypothetical protein QVD17_17449 [Tagetes erecta]|uniref:EngB-type G domain-containing protein n=1 Tax=Tagetes erecta TaxID=13708 RepID=A0AAD8NUC6_TARER|nr:hypothetical protein QVD17_17449 [Tagetes erecta]
MYGNDVGSKFGKNDARGDRRAKSEDGESRDGFLRKNGDARYDNGKNNRKFSKSESQDARSDRRLKSGNGESRDGFLRKGRYERDDNGKSRMFGKRESHDARGDRRMKSENGESRNGFSRKNGDSKHENSKTFNKWEIQDARGDRRNKSEKGENRNGFFGKNEDARYENSKQIRSPAEEQKFGRKKIKSKRDVPDDSMATFDRPRRRRRLIRIAYPYDTANKRFDDNLPTFDNTTEQKKDSDTEENVEISQNARFRAIQPSPSIISFVNENLLGRRREIEFKRAGYNIELSSPLDNIPFSTSSERERIEESIFRNKLEFFAAAKVSSSFPSADLPEIAFAGRSNVGKSSLLNSLTRQWGVVRTSDKPGLTQTINFFNLGSKLCLVDLPGYGFAYAKEEVKESWEELVKEYVSTREGLKRVCLLIDTKWGMKPRDHELVDLMERSKTKYQIVLTKTDLAFPVDVARRAMQIEECLQTKKSAIQPLMMVSSKTGAGIRSLRTVLSNVSRFARL